VACPQPNTTERDDVCLITHAYQTTSPRTNFEIYASAVSADGRLIALGGTDQDPSQPQPVLLFDYSTGRMREVRQPSIASGVALNRDGSLLATTVEAGVNTDTHDPFVRLWRTSDGAILYDLRAPVSPDSRSVRPRIFYEEVRFTHDGRYMIAGRNLGDLVIWDVATGQHVRTITPSHWDLSPSDISISPDDQWIAVVGNISGPYVTIYRRDTGARVAELDTSPLSPDESWPNGVAFSPDGTTVAIAGGCNNAGDCRSAIWLWEWETGNVRALRGHVGTPLSVVFHPDGRWLASGGIDNTLRIWDWRTGVELARMEGPAARELLTGTPAPGVPAGGGGLGSHTQGLWAPVGFMSIVETGAMIVYHETANGQARVWRLPATLWTTNTTTTPAPP
jgi:WD40 repeat protein